MPTSPTPNGDPENLALLTALLQNRDHHQSGEDLARHLGVSRVAVWNRIQRMRAEGFRFRAVQNRGYLLTKEPANLHPVLLEAYARIEGLALPIYSYPEIDSTNSEAERLLANGTEAPFCVIAGTQTAGRGRLGRSWTSSRPDNLYLSLAFRPRLPIARVQTLTPWIGLHLVRFLRECFSIPFQIKWPNDILLEGRKAAGILAEARIDNDRMRDFVFGIGFNLNSSATAFPASLRNRAISVRMATGKVTPLHPFAVRLIQVILEAFQAFGEKDALRNLPAMWEPFDYLADQYIFAANGNTRYEGRARGITPEGMLILQEKGGQTVFLRSGDITLRPPSQED